MRNPVLYLGLIVVAFIGSLHAAQIPDNSKTEVLDDFSGGLFTNSPSHKIPKNFATAMRNVYIDSKIGAIVKGNGWTNLGSNPNIVFYKGIWDLTLSSGSTDFLLFGSTVNPANSSSGVLLKTKNFQTYTTILSALDGTLDLDSVQVRNKRWFTNGSSAPFTYDDNAIQVLDGTNGTPQVPVGQFIAYYQNRVFLYNTQSENAGLYFSSLVDTTPSANFITPDNAQAWPATNALYVDRGDGKPGTFIRVFNNVLYCGKETSIYSIQGTGASSYFPYKTRAQVGFVSQKSVIELDNKLYGQAKDGFYSFDGDKTERLSDLIADQVANIYSDTNKIVSNSWVLQGDFLRGSFSNSTVTASALAGVNPTQYANVTNEQNNPPGVLTLGGSATDPSSSTAFVAMFPTVPFSPSDLYTLSTVKVWANPQNGCGGSNAQLTVNLKNLNTLKTDSQIFSFPSAVPIWQLGTLSFSGGLSFTGSEINGSSLSIQIVNSNSLIGCNSNIQSYIPNVLGADTIILKPATTGQFISDISTVTAPLISWSNFSAITNPNGGTVNLFVRSGNSVSAISNAAWSSISPGAIPSFPTTDTFVQWAASFTASNQTMPPNVGNVYINHLANIGSNTRSFSVAWNNRWWMGVSTESTGQYPLIYVKSRITNKNPNAWMQFDGIPAKHFLSLNNVLYAVSGSSGIVMRLDYGSDYNGQSIDAYYVTPDLTLSDDFTYKDIWEAILDAEKSTGETIQVGFSIDGRAFNFNSVNAGGSGRLRYSIRNPNAGLSTFCKQVSLRFENNQLDVPFTVNSMALIYKPTQIR